MAAQPDKTFSLYKGKVVIDYWDARHLYKVRGREDVPISVTGATGVIDKSGPLMYWAVNLARDYLLTLIEKKVPIDKDIVMEASKLHTKKKEEAATIGSLVHAWIHDYIRGRKPDMPQDKLVANGVIASLKWIEDHGIKIQATETIVYSKKHEYVGTKDLRFTAMWNFDLTEKENHKILHVGDWKTGNGVYDEAYFQTTAYRQADIEESGREYGSSWIIRLDKATGEPHVSHLQNHDLYFEGFLGALQTKRALKALKKERKEEEKK